ncbi:MAG: SCO family protein [Candidatus Devosia euplotis]|nr:SCO family protein [Candidatus Devosia euplotis]
MGLADFRGKFAALNFIYAICGDVCPLYSQLVAQLQSMINISPMRDRVAFISITTDPSHDQGRVLIDYGEVQGLDPVNWIFLTSSAGKPEDTTRKVARVYGLEFTEIDGMQMHGLVTRVIDPEGKLRGHFHGLNFEILSLVTFANALANDVHGPEPQDQSIWSWFGGLFH